MPVEFWIFFTFVNAILVGLAIHQGSKANNSTGEDAMGATIGAFFFATLAVAFTVIALLAKLIL
jgi:uncharacterized membrane protein YhaH (DUF805 family)